MQTEVFVSHADEDADLVRPIVKKLESGGLGVWWYKQRRFAARDFSEEIEKAIEEAQCVLVLWSQKSRSKPFVKGEANLAMDSGSKIIQLSLDGETPPVPLNVVHCEPVPIEEGTIPEDFLEELCNKIRNLIGLRGRNEHLVRTRMGGGGWGRGDLAIETPVPGLDVFLSFRPCGDSGVFILMRLDTTVGWVDSRIPTAEERHAPFADEEGSSYEEDGVKFLKVVNDIYFIMDPVRPYGIQIGGLRSMRPSAKPGIIEGKMSLDNLRDIPTKRKWICMTLAEILSTEEALTYLWREVKKNRPEGDEDPTGWDEASVNEVQKLIAKNPNAPREMQEKMCLFCKPSFRDCRRISSIDQQDEFGAFVIANDFPFGPAFHYIAITNEPVHSWEKMTYRHTRGLNLILHDFLSDEDNRRGAAGISFGFNSTIRHLILGSQTRSSAGASIPHVHKQAWGMAGGTANIAERLIEVSQAYWNYNVDFQKNYLKALDESGYVIWKNDYVALYVPYGQCSKHELQAMVLEPRGCLTDLSSNEVKSFSIAEYIALRLFKALGINSFNHVVLSKLYKDNRAPSFRLVETFITREIDLAVSELSMLFVVDQHPWDSRREILDQWNGIREEVRNEVERVDPGFFDPSPPDEVSAQI